MVLPLRPTEDVLGRAVGLPPVLSRGLPPKQPCRFLGGAAWVCAWAASASHLLPKRGRCRRSQGEVAWRRTDALDLQVSSVYGTFTTVSQVVEALSAVVWGPPSQMSLPRLPER